MTANFRGTFTTFIYFSVFWAFVMIGTGYYVDEAGAYSVGYALSFAGIASNFLLVKRIGTPSNTTFLRHFVGITGLRFILMLVVFILVIKLTKIPHIPFTVSFIFSYIPHSIIEIILIKSYIENR